VLVVYDPAVCQPGEVYEVHRELFASLQSSFGLPVHPTLLMASEERAVEFIRRSGAVAFEVAVPLLIGRCLRNGLEGVDTVSDL
jgi:hypothetical protein